MPIELKIPAVGESITEVQIAEWLKAEGDPVAADESVVTVESEKATVELPAPPACLITALVATPAASDQPAWKSAPPSARTAPADRKHHRRSVDLLVFRRSV